MSCQAPLVWGHRVVSGALVWGRGVVGAWTPALLAGRRLGLAAVASSMPGWRALSVATANGGLRSRTHHTPLADTRARQQKAERKHSQRRWRLSRQCHPPVTHRGWVGRMGAGPHSRLPQRRPASPVLTKQHQNPTKHRPRAGPENSRHAHPLARGTEAKYRNENLKRGSRSKTPSPNNQPATRIHTRHRSASTPGTAKGST